MRKVGSAFLLTGIRLYRGIATLLGVRSPCRFYPSCSVYAEQAIHRYGALGGMHRAIGRLLRCAPWNPGGFDLLEAERR